ncbi:MAG: hypothetical protein ACI9VI_002650 [Candidatus Azotimanducaceae bacterium]|jgi:hypothetical protein
MLALTVRVLALLMVSNRHIPHSLLILRYFDTSLRDFGFPEHSDPSSQTRPLVISAYLTLLLIHIVNSDVDDPRSGSG